MTFLITWIFVSFFIYFELSDSFLSYLNHKRLQKLDQVSEKFASLYIANQGWKHLESPLWQEVLEQQVICDRPSPHALAKNRRFRASQQGMFNHYSEFVLKFPVRCNLSMAQSKFRRHHNDWIQKSQRQITLLDQNYIWLAGAKSLPENLLVTPVIVNGTKVGWVGMEQYDEFYQITRGLFIYQFTKRFFYNSLTVLAISLVVIFIFTRYLLRPIQPLVIGFKKLEKREFSTRLTQTSHDEIGQLTWQFNQMAESLDYHEKMRQEWFRDISHELRTPLAILKGELEAIQDGIRSLSMERIETLRQEVERISRLILDLNQSWLGKWKGFSLKMSQNNPNELVQQIVDSMSLQFEEKQLKLKVEIQQKPCSIALDPERFAQAVGDVLQNNLQYSQSCISITTQHQKKGWSLSIADDGPGVPDEALPRLFDRLYRVDGSRKTNQGNYGLGLAIVKQIIEQHNGKVEALHNSQGGLTIQIFLPFEQH